MNSKISRVILCIAGTAAICSVISYMAYGQTTFYQSDYDDMVDCLNNARSVYSHTHAAIEQFNDPDTAMTLSKITTYSYANNAANQLLDQDVMLCVIQFRGVGQ